MHMTSLTANDFFPFFFLLAWSFYAIFFSCLFNCLGDEYWVAVMWKRTGIYHPDSPVAQAARRAVGQHHQLVTPSVIVNAAKFPRSCLSSSGPHLLTMDCGPALGNSNEQFYLCSSPELVEAALGPTLPFNFVLVLSWFLLSDQCWSKDTLQAKLHLRACFYGHQLWHNCGHPWDLQVIPP
jgi:hypothetical protein